MGVVQEITFDMNKWHVHISESVRENEIHKLLWGIELLTDYLTLTRGSDIITINKNILLARKPGTFFPKNRLDATEEQEERVICSILICACSRKAK